MAEIFASDIGGTNSRFGHFGVDGQGRLVLKKSVWIKTADSGSFNELIDRLEQSGFTLKPQDADCAVIAVAGPVQGGVRSAPPFIKWAVDISNAREELGFRRISLINDFVAQAWACRSPVGEEAEQELPGEPEPGATLAVLGAGTGLGKAALVPDGRGGFSAMPSEGGHAEFPFVTEEEFRFRRFVLEQTGLEHITGNTVVSGGGISHVHHFLTGEALAPEEVTRHLSEGSETLEWAARFYGRTARDFALETLSLGGLYVAGGVAARTPALLRHGAFEAEFRSSETMAEVLGKIPVYLINDQQSGLWGAASLGSQELKRNS